MARRELEIIEKKKVKIERKRKDGTKCGIGRERISKKESAKVAGGGLASTFSGVSPRRPPSQQWGYRSCEFDLEVTLRDPPVGV